MKRLILCGGGIVRRGTLLKEWIVVKADDFMPDKRRRRDRVKVFQNEDQPA